MKRWERLWQTLEQPAYRTKLAFFLILGVSVFLLSALLQSRSSFWSDVLREFAIAFSAVGVLQLLWDFLGGEPLELRIAEVKEEVKSIKSGITPLSDLMNGNIGIERIWPDRRAWYLDSGDGLREWHIRVCEAKHVDILSNTLWNNWLHDGEFRSRLFKNIAHGAHVRILIYDPEADVVRRRAADEKDVPGEMQQEIKASLVSLARGWTTLPHSAKANLEVCLTTSTVHPVQMIRADEHMLVAHYLVGKSGGPSPTMQLRGNDSVYFRKYTEQFQTLWDRARVLNDAQFARILEEYGKLSPPLVETPI